MDPSTQNVSVIICDDHLAVAEGLSHVIEEACEEINIVGLARSAEEAERLVQELAPDIVLMDIYMPRVDGIEATRRIRRVAPTTQVVMLTVSEESSHLYEALRAGAVAFITKSADSQAICAKLRAVIQGSCLFPAAFIDRLVADLGKTEPYLSLTASEKLVLSGIAKGETDREMAARLHMSERTIRRRVQTIYSKLHLVDRLQAAIYATEKGFARGQGRE